MSFIREKLFLEKTHIVISSFLLIFFLFSLIKIGSFNYEGKIGFTLFDDAMISMRYAYNFLNDGIIEWSKSSGNVEGLTNIGWMFIMSLAIKLSNLYTAPLLISITSFSFLIIGFLILLRSPNYQKLDINFQISAFVGSFSILFWSIRGFEVSILFLFYSIVFSYLSFFKKNRTNTFITATSIFFGTFIRDDFAIIVFIFIFIKILVNFLKSRNFLNLDKEFILILSITAIALIIKIYLRYQYFGEFLPNTYYLKVYGHDKSLIFFRGLLSNLRNIFSGILLVPLFAISVLFIKSKKVWIKTFNKCISYSSLELTSAFFIYNFLTGGDAWEWSGLLNRFLCFAEPFIILDMYCFILNYFEIQDGFYLEKTKFQYKKLIKLFSFLCLGSLLISVLISIPDKNYLISGMGNYKKIILQFFTISLTILLMFFFK